MAVVIAGAALAAWAVPAPPAAATDTITVGQAANGSHRRLHRGDLLVVRLPSSPSTGYAWKVGSGARPVLRYTGRTYIPPSDGRPLGGAGTAVLRFRAVSAGRTVLRLLYVRPWETGVPPARTFTLRVSVSVS